jgi:hypothetical protein
MSIITYWATMEGASYATVQAIVNAMIPEPTGITKGMAIGLSAIEVTSLVIACTSFSAAISHPPAAQAAQVDYQSLIPLGPTTLPGLEGLENSKARVKAIFARHSRGLSKDVSCRQPGAGCGRWRLVAASASLIPS